MPRISFPNVPESLGVPPVSRSAQYPPTARVVLGAVQGMLWRSAQISTQWGIWDAKGVPLGNPDRFTGLTDTALQSLGLTASLSTGSVERSKEMRVSDFPVEEGGFASYNKVELPGTHNVTLCFGGSETERAAFIAKLEEAIVSTELYSVVTPEITYIDYTISRLSYPRRNSSGAYMLIVELELKEIRQVSAVYSVSGRGNIVEPQNAGSAQQVDTGTVQPKTPDKSTLLKIKEKLPGLADTASKYLNGLLK